MEGIEARTTAVLKQIKQAAASAGRSLDDITLIAVTKTWPVEVLLSAYEAGLRHFGENRTHELEEKRPLIEANLGQHSGIHWHYIGHLQSRKAQEVADFADSFHAVERLKIVNKLQAQLAENGRLLTVFIEVNVSGEMSKSGINCANWESSATQQAEVRKVAQAIMDSPNLSLQGLMTMAPWGAPKEEIQQVFRRTRQLAEWLPKEVGAQRPLHLSMGMTDDFELAIAEGATHIRVGRAIFGERH